MSKQKPEEDDGQDRDIFETALDYAPVIGAVLGYGGARLLGRKSRLLRKKRYEDLEAKVNAYIRNPKSPLSGLAPLQRARWKAEADISRPFQSLTGTVLGASGGYVAQQSRKKRRK